jgi:hypothetical protein
VAEFRVRYIDGTERAVEAQRVSTAGEQVVFEERVPETWRRIYAVPCDRVETVQRRIVEYNGTMRWISVPYEEVGAPR